MLTAAVLQLGVVALQLVLYILYFFPVQAVESARALEQFGTPMPAQNLYEQLLLNEDLYWLLPRRPLQLVLLVVTWLAAAFLLSCVRLHRGWRRGVAVIIGVICAVCCGVLFHNEQYAALYGLNEAVVESAVRAVPVLAVLVLVSLVWALRAIRRAEPA